ncbi:hypothetical protein ANO11243_090150 [Dothideomycetidae sp. 11243]|nr:hypothetical protein ANO11243_090150 [fungal sp. No.11243]
MASDAAVPDPGPRPSELENGHDAGQVPVETSVDPTAAGISADEIALYDRQIRLWGVQAQERIRSAKVLLINVKAVGTEIAKNLILNGIGSLTIVDNGVVTESDLGAQYFLRDDDVGSNRAQTAATRLQELNPRVGVLANASDPMQFTDEFYKQFDLIVATDLPFLTTAMINAATRMAMRPFYATGVHGFYGFIFADLVEHEYIIERERSNIYTVVKAETTTRSITAVSTKKEKGKNIELVTKKEMYSPLLLANSSPLSPEYLKNRRKMKGVSALLPALRALWDFERAMNRFPGHSREDLVMFTTMANEKLLELQLPADTLKAEFLRSFLQNVGSEIVPTAAFVGGRLAEDAINVLGKREQPIQNFLLFDGDTFQAPIYALHPIFENPTAATNGTAPAMPSHTPAAVAAAVSGVSTPVPDIQAVAPPITLDALVPQAMPVVQGPGGLPPGYVDNAISTEPPDGDIAAMPGQIQRQ